MGSRKNLTPRAIASQAAGEELEQGAVIPAGLEGIGFDRAPGRGLVRQERQRNAPQQGQVVGRVSRAHQQPNVLRVSGAHSLRDESRSRRPLDALVGQCQHALRPISSRTPTSRCRFATADHPGPARGSRQGAGRAAIGTLDGQLARSHLSVQQHVQP
jgi:hypothetical protein